MALARMRRDHKPPQSRMRRFASPGMHLEPACGSEENGHGPAMTVTA